MANDENLIPFDDRSESEVRELGRKGGIASGKARREKKGIRSALKMMAEMEHPDSKLTCEMEGLGIETTNEVALAFTVFMNAIKRGDYKAMESIMSAIGDHADKEQAQINKINAETEKVEVETKLATQTDEDMNKPIKDFTDSLYTSINTEGIYDDPATE